MKSSRLAKGDGFFPYYLGSESRAPEIFQITGWLKERNSFVNFGPLPGRSDRPHLFFPSRDQEISLRDRKQGVPKEKQKKTSDELMRSELMVGFENLGKFSRNGFSATLF